MAKLRTLSLCVLAGALFGASVSSAQPNRIVITPSNRIVSPVDDTQLTTLRGTVSPLASRRNDLGAAPEGLQLQRMHLVLKRSDSQEAALKQLIDEMHTPGSPNYHKWLTPDQFGAQFGPSDQDIAAVTTWLTTHGFNVSGVNPGRQTMEISGSVAQLRNAFHTQIHQYSVSGQTRYSNANDPQIPAALAPVVGGFVSLNNFPIRSYAHPLGKALYDPKTNQATPQWTMGSGSSLSFVLAPKDYAVQYDLNSLYTAGVNGAGQTIAIINEANINVALVNQFRSLFGLPNNPPQVIIDGNDPGIDGANNPGGPNFASVEAYLDVEWAGAVAPNATIDLVIAADTPLQSGLILAAERAVYSNLAPVISVSFGNCEANIASGNAFLSTLWEQAAAQGITVAVSTGDAGSAGCDNDSSQSYAVGGQAVNGFASTPFNVAVGGTDFFYSQYNGTSSALAAQIATYWNTSPSNSTPAVSLLQPVPEQPWNASQYGLNINSYYNSFQDTTIAGAGGGASNAALCSGGYNSSTGLCISGQSGYPKPAWQTGVTGIPADGVRDTPDVSLFASSGINASFYPICASDGDCQPASGGTVQIYGVGGTSASTPAFAGIMALVNQKYGRQGQANTVLYPLAKQFPASFHDVTNGNISVPCEFGPTVSANCISVSNPISVPGSAGGTIIEGRIGTGTTPLYNATAGYDLATGLGTIDAAVLVNNWNKITLATTTTTMTATPANSVPLSAIPHGTSVTIAGAVTGSGAPTGDVALMTDNTEQSQQFATKYTLANGSYTGTTPILPGGTYNIWAQYGGDSVNGMSTSAKTQITVTPEASTVNLNMFSGNKLYKPGTGPGTSVDYGTQLLLSALVAPSTQAAALQTCLETRTGCSGISFTYPTGTVNFADNGSTLKTAALNNEGDAEYNAPFSVGTHSVTASYAGDKSYGAAPTTLPIAFTVVKDTPSLLLDASAIASSNGSTSVVNGPNQPLVITIQVLNGAQTSAATSSEIFPVPVAPPTGTVTVSGLPSNVPTTATLLTGVDPASQGGYQAPQGIANFVIPAGTTSGTFNATFTYNGDSNYNSNSSKFTLPIVNTTGKGLTSTITGTISGTTTSPTGALTVTGTVTGTNTASNEPLKLFWPATGGTVLAVLFFFVPRRRRNWLAMTILLLFLVSGIVIGCGGGGSSNNGGNNGGGTTGKAPTGTVFVYASGYYIATYNVVAPSTGITSTFSGVLNSQTIPQGANQITLQYSGDSAYNPSAFTLSNPISNPMADFSLIPASSNVPVTAGGSGTTSINLASVNGFAGTVNLTCTAATGVTCSLPSPATLTNGGSASATLTVAAPAGAATGNYNVLVTGTDTSGKYIHTLAITAIVR
jgi:subtilase family serine protease